MTHDRWWAVRRWWGFQAIFSTLGGAILVGAVVGGTGVVVPAVWSAASGALDDLPGLVIVGSIIGAMLGVAVAAAVLLASLVAYLLLRVAHASGLVETAVLFVVGAAGGALVCWLLIRGFLGWQIAAISTVGALVAAAWVVHLSRGRLR